MPCLSATYPSGAGLLAKVITGTSLLPAQKPPGFQTEQMPPALTLYDIPVDFIQGSNSLEWFNSH